MKLTGGQGIDVPDAHRRCLRGWLASPTKGGDRSSVGWLLQPGCCNSELYPLSVRSGWEGAGQRQGRCTGQSRVRLRAGRRLYPSLLGAAHSLAASPQGTTGKVSTPSSSLPPASSQTAAPPTTTMSWRTSSCKWPTRSIPAAHSSEGPTRWAGPCCKNHVGWGALPGTREGLGRQQTCI